MGSLARAANNIDGAVTLDANKSSVKLARNYIAGEVTSSANLKGTTISSNRITGGLDLHHERLGAHAGMGPTLAG